MRMLLVAFVLAWSMLGGETGGRAEGQEDLTRRDAQGSVTVVVTLMPPATPDGPVKARVVLDTHSVALDGVALQDAVVMQTPDGREVRPSAVEEASGGGHHRQAVLVFPPVTQPGALRIVVRNVGGVAARTFAWERPAR
jgi:hypothetical protein